MPESIHKQQHNTWPAPVFKLKLLVQQIYISITEHHNYQISFAFNCCYKSHFASVYCITKSFYEKLCDINQYIFYELYSYEVSICSQTPKMSIFFHVSVPHKVRLNDLVWRNKYMRNETKSKIYKVNVRHIRKYAVETRGDIIKKHKCWKQIT